MHFQIDLIDLSKSEECVSHFFDLDTFNILVTYSSYAKRAMQAKLLTKLQQNGIGHNLVRLTRVACSAYG